MEDIWWYYTLEYCKFYKNRLFLQQLSHFAQVRNEIGFKSEYEHRIHKPKIRVYKYRICQDIQASLKLMFQSSWEKGVFVVNTKEI